MSESAPKIKGIRIHPSLIYGTKTSAFEFYNKVFEPFRVLGPDGSAISNEEDLSTLVDNTDKNEKALPRNSYYFDIGNTAISTKKIFDTLKLNSEDKHYWTLKEIGNLIEAKIMNNHGDILKEEGSNYFPVLSKDRKHFRFIKIYKVGETWDIQLVNISEEANPFPRNIRLFARNYEQLKKKHGQV